MFEVSADSVLTYFSGSWRLKRQVTDQPLMFGEAQFTPNATQAHQLDFIEHISWLNAKGQQLQAQRAYCYRRTDAGLAIDFADGINAGALFLAFDFDRAHELTSHHLCIADHYDGHFVFHSAQAFELSFQVIGPHKDYRIQTHFER